MREASRLVGDLLGSLRRLGAADWRNGAQVLLISSLVAQAINVGAIPLLTRVYDPSTYVVLGVLMALTVIGGLMAGFGFEFGVPVAKHNEEAAALVQVAASAALLTSLAVAAVACMLPATTTAQALGPSWGFGAPWIAGVPIFATSIGAILEAYQLRRKRFRVIAGGRLAQAILGVSVQLGLGLSGWAATGLVAGYLAMLMVPCIIHGIDIAASRGMTLASFAAMWRTAQTYRRFAAFTAPESLLNAVSVHGPILLIGYASVGPAVVSHLSLGMRLLQAPSFLIAKTGSQIVQASMLSWQADGSLERRIRLMARNYAIGGSLAGAAIMLLAPLLTGVILGDSWADAGWVIALLVPGIILHMISYPMIPVAYLKARNASLLAITAGSSIMRLALCAIAMPYGDVLVVLAFTSGAIFQYGILTSYLLSIVKSQRPTPSE